jgi:hypothetical protein
MNIQTETVIQSYIDSASRSTLACLCNVNVQTAFVTNYPSLQMQPQDCNSKRQSTKCRSALAYNESVIVSHQRNAHDLPQEPEPQCTVNSEVWLTYSLPLGFWKVRVRFHSRHFFSGSLRFAYDSGQPP